MYIEKEGTIFSEGRTQEWADWHEKGGLVHCQDRDLVLTIPTNVGDDTVIEDEHGGEKRVMHGYRDGRTEIRLEVMSFRGISFDAIHYYGRLEGPYIAWKTHRESTWSSNIFVKTPAWAEQIHVELMRKLTQEEIDEFGTDKEDRFYGYNVGDDTNCFQTVTQVIERAKEVFDKWFKPEGWTLFIQECDIEDMEKEKKRGI